MRPLRKFWREVRSRSTSETRESHIPTPVAPPDEEVAKHQPNGLIKLFQSKEAVQGSPAVDVVAVHGLNGDSKRTWTHPNGTFWLKDLLPDVLPNARIFTYGYPSAVLSNKVVGSVRHFAWELLSEIQANRDGEKRPIIFICHSLGGIVVKKAMILADEQEHDFNDIWVHSQAIVFMGTPHGGSSTAEYGYVLSRIAEVAANISGINRFTGAIRSDLIQNLKASSEELKSIGESFISRSGHFHIASFYETKQFPGLNDVIVGESSAVLGLEKERRRPLYLDHRDICRYSGKGDQSFLIVRHVLQEFSALIVKTEPGPSPSLVTNSSYTADEKECIRLLNSVDVDGYQSRLNTYAEGTLSWIHTTAQFLQWISSNGSEFLWIFGSPGWGKTTMAAYLVEYLSSRYQDLHICRFFCNGNINEQRNAVSILQSLIYQLVLRQTRLVRQVKKFCEERGQQILNQFDGLWNLFSTITRQQSKRRVIVVIDGMDECEKDTQHVIFTKVIAFVCSEAPTNVRFLITSRYSRAAMLSIPPKPNLQHLDLEEHQKFVSNDIDIFIKQRLRWLGDRGGLSPPSREVLEKGLIANAGHTFLWADLVLRHLERRGFTQLKDVSDISSLIPSDLAAMYEQLLYAIKEADRSLASRMLRIVTISSRPLSAEELGTLLTIDSNTKSTSQLTKDLLLCDEGNVRYILSDLVRVSNSKIELVHHSLREFLLRLDSLEDHQLSQSFGVNIPRDAAALNFLCRQYLLLDDFVKDVCLIEGSSTSKTSSRSSSTSTDEVSPLFELQGELSSMFHDPQLFDHNTCKHIQAKYKLFDYASTQWALDFSRFQNTASKQEHERAINLCNDTTRTANWWRYHWYNVYPRITPPMLEPGMMLAYFGLEPTLRHYLKTNLAISSYEVSQAVFWASREGHTECVVVLLEQTLFKAGLAVWNNQNALCAAAEFGHVECLSKLLESQAFDLNKGDYKGRSPLSLAAANGHEESVRMLLSFQETDTNRRDREGATPLLWASLGGSASIVKLILKDLRTDSSYVDKSGRNALSRAVKDGSEEVVKALIYSRKFDLSHKDSRGYTALSYAVMYERLGTVKLLIKKSRSLISECDNEGRNAISWAAEQRSEDVLRYLIEHDEAAAAVAKDVSDWMPMLWALQPPGYPANIRALLKVAGPSVNLGDHGNRTILSWAAGYGYVEIVQDLLLVEGIDVDARDVEGRTALSYAAGCGAVEVVESLLRAGADIGLRDGSGRTALFWAVIEGRYAATKVLLGQPRCSTTELDTNDRELIDIAREYGRRDIETLLAEN